MSNFMRQGDSEAGNMEKGTGKEQERDTEAVGQKQGCSWPGGWGGRGQRSKHPSGHRSSHGTVLCIRVPPWFHQ